jgi:hypothetical protein
MPDGLYDQAILAWSARQADLLSCLGRGERANDVDSDNIADEIEGVGRPGLHAVASDLDRIITHLLTIDAAPGDESVAHWQTEIRTFQRSARRRFTDSMRQHIDPASLYDDIVKSIRMSVAGTNPFTLDDLLSAPVDQLLE